MVDCGSVFPFGVAASEGGESEWSLVSFKDIVSVPSRYPGNLSCGVVEYPCGSGPMWAVNAEGGTDVRLWETDLIALWHRGCGFVVWGLCGGKDCLLCFGLRLLLGVGS